MSALALGLPLSRGPVRCSRAARAPLLRCPQTPSACMSALALGLPLSWGPVRCSRAPLLRCPQTPSACMSALALGLPLLSSHSWFRPLAEHGLDARQVALGLADLHWVGERGGGPPQAQMEELVGELVLARAQLDVAQVTHFLPFHLTLLGARPVLAPCGRCALPMPPDPVGQLERSRARPPSLLGARPVLMPPLPCDGARAAGWRARAWRPRGGAPPSRSPGRRPPSRTACVRASPPPPRSPASPCPCPYGSRLVSW